MPWVLRGKNAFDGSDVWVNEDRDYTTSSVAYAHRFASAYEAQQFLDSPTGRSATLYSTGMHPDELIEPTAATERAPAQVVAVACDDPCCRTRLDMVGRGPVLCHCCYQRHSSRVAFARRNSIGASEARRLAGLPIDVDFAEDDVASWTK
jgi:hypothetical protein